MNRSVGTILAAGLLGGLIILAAWVQQPPWVLYQWVRLTASPTATEVFPSEAACKESILEWQAIVEESYKDVQKKTGGTLEEIRESLSEYRDYRLCLPAGATP